LDDKELSEQGDKDHTDKNVIREDAIEHVQFFAAVKGTTENITWG
jgi:hypothetical protein